MPLNWWAESDHVTLHASLDLVKACLENCSQLQTDMIRRLETNNLSSSLAV